jgi:hypothetical protein
MSYAEERHVLHHIGVRCVHVHVVGALEDGLEVVVPEAKGQHGPANHARDREAPTNVVVHVEGNQVLCRVVERRTLALFICICMYICMYMYM